MPKLCGIYRIVNTQNDKKYIGSSNDIKVRWRNHRYQLNNKKHPNKHLQGAWNKYGKSNFIFEIICLCDVNDLSSKEQFYIDEMHPEYNMSKYTESPMRGRTHTEETRNILKDIGKHFMTPEKNHKMLSTRYKDHIYVQKKFVPKEVRSSHLSQAFKKVWSNPEYKEKMSSIRINQVTDNTRKKFSNQSKLNWMNSDFRDKSIKSRQKVASEGRGNTKYTIQDVINIRKLHWDDGMSAKSISKLLDMSYYTVRSILYNNWKWVK